MARGAKQDTSIIEIDEAWAASILPRREAGAHKWSVGGVVVLAGSPQYMGAAVLCCMAAGRSGAGVVTAALPRALVPVVVGAAPEVAIAVLPEGDGQSAARRAAEAIKDRVEKSKALAIGHGLGSDEAIDALMSVLFGVARSRPSIGFSAGSGAGDSGAESLVTSSGLPLVVDADGLNWLARQDEWWRLLPEGRAVLTPHAAEMARLTGKEQEEITADPIAAAREAAATWGQTVVLKGTKTVIATADGSVTTVEMPLSLATAGSGDVLCGSIGAFLAQGLSGADAASLAAFVGSRAAARLAERFGTLGVVASDMPLAIAEELAALERVRG